MSLGLPKIRPNEDGTSSSALGGPDSYGTISMMNSGLSSTVKDQAGGSVHPLEFSEKHWSENQAKMSMAAARNTQGISMPLKLNMERSAAKQMVRLPCMATRSSNLLLDTLTGDDEMLTVADAFSSRMEFPEVAGSIHAIMEKRAGVFH